jgi:hypothetical protein
MVWDRDTKPPEFMLLYDGVHQQGPERTTAFIATFIDHQLVP